MLSAMARILESGLTLVLTKPRLSLVCVILINVKFKVSLVLVQD